MRTVPEKLSPISSLTNVVERAVVGGEVIALFFPRK